MANHATTIMADGTLAATTKKHAALEVYFEFNNPFNINAGFTNSLFRKSRSMLHGSPDGAS